MRMIVGLGNPGQEYERTRHNIGFIMLDNLCYRYGMQWSTGKKFTAEIAEGQVGDEKVILVKPRTYMNESGRAVRAVADFYKIDPVDILIIHDDADMNFGKVKIASGGSDGGHKGIISLNQHGFEQLWRIKIGVANERRLPGQAIDFVLTRFEQDEWDKLTHLAENVALRVDSFINSQLKTETISWL